MKRLTIERLLRNAVYVHGAGFEDDGPEPIRGQSFEIPARVDGQRVFMATDDRGELVGFGLMQPGGNRVDMAHGLYALTDEVSLG